MSWRWTVALLAVVATGCAGSSDGDGTVEVTTGAPAGALTTVTTVTSPGSTVAPTTGATMPAETTATTTATTTTTGEVPQGFELVPGRVTAADGEVCDVCLWLAATPEQRGRGLMGVTDLGAGDGMVFRWDEPTTGNFWMRDTPQPLSIAFYAADGAFVSAADMEPCLQPIPDADCPRYAAASTYTYAVEVFAGGLPPLLMGPGSRLELLAGGCPGTT